MALAMYADSAYTPYLPSLLEPLASSAGVLQAWPLRHYNLLWLGHNLSGCNDHLGTRARGAVQGLPVHHSDLLAMLT